MLPQKAAEKWKHLHNTIRAERCRETGLWLVSADVTGERYGCVSWGPTAVINPAGEVAAASFSPDGARVVAASLDHSAYIWRLNPLIVMQADRRRAYMCHERLIGAPSFSDREMQDPLLRGREELRNPCDRLGPLSASYYRRGFAGLAAALRNALAR